MGYFDAKLDKLSMVILNAMSSTTVSEFCHIVAGELVSLFDQYNCCILLIEEASNQLIEIQRSGECWTEQGLANYQNDVTRFNSLIRDRQSILTTPARGATKPLVDPFLRWSKVIIPIKDRTNFVVGLLYLCTPSDNKFAESDIDRLYQFGGNLAIIVQNIQFYETLQEQIVLLEANVQQNTVRLENEQYRLQSILNSTSDAIVITSLEGEIQQYNQAFKDLYDLTGEAFIGQDLHVFIDTRNHTSIANVLDMVRKDGISRRVEVVLTYKGRFICYADIAVSIMMYDQSTAYIYSIRDNTAYKELETDLRESLRKEQESSTLRTRFVSMVSHEFRTPLATIQSAVELLADYLEQMTPQQRQTRISKIKSQINHMTLLMEDVLTVGRIEAGKIVCELAYLNLDKLAQTIIRELKLNTDKEIEFAYSCNLPDQTIVADIKLMRQVITNILSNAVKYSESPATIKLDITFDEDMVRMQFKDEGIGIPQQDQAHLFEPFYRSTNVGSIQGTGLGLAITKHAVELHNGQIDFNSVPGEGTTFNIQIPLVKDLVKE